MLCRAKGVNMSLSDRQSFRQQMGELAELIVTKQSALQPEGWKAYGHPGREKSVRDVGYHLSYLAEALEAGDPALFSEYLAWVKVLFAGLKFPEHILPETLECTRHVLAEKLSGEVRTRALDVLGLGL